MITETVDEIIEKMLPLTYSLVKRFVREFPKAAPHYDDLLGVAQLKLVERCRSTDFTKFENFKVFSVYLRLYIQGRCVDYLNSLDSFLQLGSGDPCDGRRSSTPEIDVINQLFRVAADHKDRAILQARLCGGKTIMQVAEITGLSAQTVGRRLKNMKIRYDRQ